MPLPLLASEHLRLVSFHYSSLLVPLSSCQYVLTAGLRRASILWRERMTLVVGVNLGQCAIITADSRVTSEWQVSIANANFLQDYGETSSLAEHYFSLA
jgi:hypothetical protein